VPLNIEKMIKIILLLTGGAIGTLARYSLSGLAQRWTEGTFPLGTLIVNMVGSFIIGLLWGLWEDSQIKSNTRTFIFVGVLGGFTTFSSFMLESLNLYRDGDVKLALFNILVHNILGIVLVILGFFVAKILINFAK